MGLAQAVNETRERFYRQIADDLRAGLTHQECAAKRGYSVRMVDNIAKKMKVQRKDLIIERYLA
jgi:hypothetical protein